MTDKIESMIDALETAIEQDCQPVAKATVGRLMNLIDRYEEQGAALPVHLKDRAERLAEQASEDMFDNMPV